MKKKALEELKTNNELIEFGLEDNSSSDSNPSEDDLPQMLKNKIIPIKKQKNPQKKRQIKRLPKLESLIKKKNEESANAILKISKEIHTKKFPISETKTITRLEKHQNQIIIQDQSLNYNMSKAKEAFRTISESKNAIESRSQSENKYKKYFRSAM